MRTCLVSQVWDRNTSTDHHHFLIESIHYPYTSFPHPNSKWLLSHNLLPLCRPDLQPCIHPLYPGCHNDWEALVVTSIGATEVKHTWIECVAPQLHWMTSWENSTMTIKGDAGFNPPWMMSLTGLTMMAATGLSWWVDVGVQKWLNIRVWVGVWEGTLRNVTAFSRGVSPQNASQTVGTELVTARSIVCSHNFLFWPPASQIESTTATIVSTTLVHRESKASDEEIEHKSLR